MIGPGAGDEFAGGFLDDYFAECEEHLTVVRRALLALDADLEHARRDSGLLEELFRSVHTLKGISAMVDLREAEQVAHELESYLRALRAGERDLTAEALTVLIDGTAMLERVIASRRAGEPGPSVEGTVRTLASLGEGNPAGRATGPPQPATGAAPAPDAPTWRFIFVPSAALVDRGVKVDAIRARLSSVGQIASVSPKVTAGGGIAFEFIVSGPADAAAFERWRADGLSWEPFDPPAAPEATVDPGALASSPPAAEPAILAPSHFVRVDLKRLDEVMRRVADLVMTRARFEGHLARLARTIPAPQWRAFQEDALTFERQLRDLREDVMRIRLVRVDEIFRRMPFVARDVGREAGKDVRVVLSGQGTEIDKFLVERMMDPVLHLVRNAVSHGIERPDTRLAAGKPAQGVVTLRASTAGEMVLLEIADDGAGIDGEAVAERARAEGLRLPDGPLDARTLADVICRPGFSTREAADRASGRGMGMSIVRTTIQELGGTLSLDTATGQGTCFSVLLPLTLAITDALIAVASGHTFAVPQNAVQEVMEVDATAVRRLENNELVPYRGGSLPLLRLDTLFRLGGDRPPSFHAFVVGTGQDAVALGVDRILGQREIVVRPTSDALLRVEGVSGATELGDGKVVLILDAATLARQAHAGARTSGSRHAGAALDPQPSSKGALA